MLAPTEASDPTFTLMQRAHDYLPILHEELREWRLVSGKGAPRTNELLIHLIARVGRENGSEFVDENRGIARQIVRGIHDPTKGLAFGKTVLLCRMFGDWRTLLERCNWLEVVGPPIEDTRHNTPIKQRVPDVTGAHREKCLA